MLRNVTMQPYDSPKVVYVIHCHILTCDFVIAKLLINWSEVRILPGEPQVRDVNLSESRGLRLLVAAVTHFGMVHPRH